MTWQEKVSESAELTEFQKAVLLTLQFVPKGKVTTYGTIASRLGQGNPRSVGQALKKNPFAPECPCHRVVRADGTLGGYSGNKVSRKIALLEEEGFVITKSKDGPKLATFVDALAGENKTAIKPEEPASEQTTDSEAAGKEDDQPAVDEQPALDEPPAIEERLVSEEQPAVVATETVAPMGDEASDQKEKATGSP